jgi:lipopolysaccharide/colanic/teichoic acid biosynthesis glycosyltransferase
MAKVTQRVASRARTGPGRWPPAGSRATARAAKRVVDVALGSLLAVLLAPLMLALAGVLAVQLGSGPVFVHDRVGRRGRPFRFPKLRTLPPATPRYADKTTSELCPPSRLASFLRSRHLDELPQLLLVPLGSLSLVGPRPKMLDEHEPIDPLLGTVRTFVRQGCTGLWQIGEHNGRRVTDAPVYDLFYLRFGSLRMDAWILWRTVVQTFGGPSVTLSDVPRWTRGRGLLATDEELALDLALDLALADMRRDPTDLVA